MILGGSTDLYELQTHREYFAWPGVKIIANFLILYLLIK